jgi:IclR family transcriptional regulator, KDG regulon repressor
VPAVVSSMRILDFIAVNGSSRGARVHVASGLNASTCHDILKTLVYGGYLAYDEASKKYSLGPVLAAIGAQNYSDENLVSRSRPYLVNWSRETQFTAFIAQWLPDRTIVILDKVDSPLDIKMTVQIGQRFPWSAAALGKAFMAYMDENQIRSVVGSDDLPAYTPKSIRAQRSWLAELSSVRERGWSTSLAEYYRSTNSVAAPIFGPDDTVLAVVGSLATVTDLKDADIERFGAVIRQMADDIHSALG